MEIERNNIIGYSAGEITKPEGERKALKVMRISRLLTKKITEPPSVQGNLFPDSLGQEDEKKDIFFLSQLSAKGMGLILAINKILNEQSYNKGESVNLIGVETHKEAVQLYEEDEKGKEVGTPFPTIRTNYYLLAKEMEGGKNPGGKQIKEVEELIKELGTKVTELSFIPDKGPHKGKVITRHANLLTFESISVRDPKTGEIQKNWLSIKLDAVWGRAFRDFALLPSDILGRVGRTTKMFWHVFWILVIQSSYGTKTYKRSKYSLLSPFVENSQYKKNPNRLKKQWEETKKKLLEVGIITEPVKEEKPKGRDGDGSLICVFQINPLFASKRLLPKK